MPGDRVRAVVGKSKRAYAEARAVEILAPAPTGSSRAPSHPGAPWQVLSYERQLEIKQDQVDDALQRIGKLQRLHARADHSGDRSRGATATSSSTRSAPIPPAG